MQVDQQPVCVPASMPIPAALFLELARATIIIGPDSSIPLTGQYPYLATAQIRPESEIDHKGSGTTPPLHPLVVVCAKTRKAQRTAPSPQVLPDTTAMGAEPEPPDPSERPCPNWNL